MTRLLSRRTAVASLLCLSLAAAAQADSGYPARPIKLVVPASAGGEPDILARLVAHRMAADLGQPIVVDNKVGAGGLIGVASVASAKADGYTIGIVYQAVLALSPQPTPTLSATQVAERVVAQRASCVRAFGARKADGRVLRRLA